MFCNAKAALLHCKSVGFATQNSRFRNTKSKLSFFLRTIFTKLKLFLRVFNNQQNKSTATFLLNQTYR
ncbi:hypothetical protein CTM58_01955 [Prevotella intermedia]|uniref:Uncharacterized protein n=1 Tax=Prevotella intermedia TaxID=28131 RepID=A0A2M8TST1_PREIN|nr:hypothetical protein CTM58_01955 [Prevotella intermedia]